MIPHLVRRRPALALLIGLLCAGVPLGCSKSKNPDDPSSPVAPVKAVQPETILLGEWTELIGTTQPLPRHAARLSAAVEGRVLWVLGDGKGPAVTEGQQVDAGQVVVQLDDRVARANRGKVQAAQAELAELKKQADLAVDLAQIEVKRLEELGKPSSANAPLPLVSRIELEKARVLLKDAESKQKAVLARQKAGEADLKALDEQLDLYTLRAPIKGRLGLLQVVPGQTLTVGTPVADVLNLDEIDVLGFVPPHVAARLKLDQTSRLAADEGSASGTPGKVVFIAVQAQPETGNFAVKARFPNGDLRLRANAVQRVLALTKPEAKRLTVPRTALMEDQDPPAVVIVEDIETKTDDHGKQEKIGTVRKLQAKLGVRDHKGEHVEVLGLYDPEKKKEVAAREAWFVTEGAHGLETGDKVKLEEEKHKEEK